MREILCDLPNRSAARSTASRRKESQTQKVNTGSPSKPPRRRRPQDTPVHSPSEAEGSTNESRDSSKGAPSAELYPSPVLRSQREKIRRDARLSRLGLERQERRGMSCPCQTP